ncbi:MAK10-like protein [Tanacetum coccineum]|uniref:MAK10-like protein n=1 Tax=Tanacetum coccineum TaxID=301880 RepID=A0ABQ5AMC3_9ASTR
MGDENPIRTLGDYSKPSHEGYMNTIELPIGNNVVPLRSDTIRLDHLTLDGENKERTRLRLFQFSLHDQASNWLERLQAGSITTWEDLTTRFLAQLFPPGRTAKLRNDILIGPHDIQYCMKDPEQAFVEYSSSRTDKAGDRSLPRDMVKNPKLSTALVLSARSYPNMDPQCSNHIYGSIDAVTIHPKQQSNSYDDREKENKEEEKDNSENIHANPSIPPDPLVSFITEKVLKFNSFFESLGLVPQLLDIEVVCKKGDDGEVMFIVIIRKNDDSREEGPEEEGSTTTEGWFLQVIFDKKKLGSS